MSKSETVHVTDAKTIKAIELNGFSDPIPIEKTDKGYIVPRWSLDQYRERLLQRERSVCSSVASEFDCSEPNSTRRSR